MTFQMIQPNSAFMSENAWVHPPWKASHPKSSHPVQTLIDEAYLFLQVYTDFFSLSNAVQVASYEDSDISMKLAQLLEKAESIKNNIDYLHAAIQGQDVPSGENVKQTSVRPEIFQARFPQWSNNVADPDERELGKAFPIAYAFTDFAIATAFVFFHAFQICIMGFIRNMQSHLRLLGIRSRHLARVEDPSHKDAMQRASHICQAGEYFLNPGNKVIGAMIYLFPIAVAKRTIARMCIGDSLASNEVRRKYNWCEMIDRKLAEDYKLSPYDVGE